MYNVIRSQELRAHGVHSRVVKSAVDCCLLRLTRGMYSVIRRCENPQHARIAELITDEDWSRRVREHTQSTQKHDYEYADLLEKLKIASYPHYRVDDVICGVSAARIHDLPLYRVGTQRIHIASPSHRLRTGIVSRTTREVPAADTVMVGKMRLTSPALTSLDLIPQIGEPGAFAAMESVVRRSVFGAEEASAGRFGYPPDVGQLERKAVEEHFAPVLARLPKGRARAARLIGRIGARSESYAESRCSYNLSVLGLCGFEQQVQVHEKGRLVARVDFMDRVAKTVLFVDGAAKYVENGGARSQKEATQFNRLVALGYRIVRFTFAEVMDLEAFATKLYGQAPWSRGRVTRNRSV